MGDTPSPQGGGNLSTLMLYHTFFIFMAGQGANAGDEAEQDSSSRHAKDAQTAADRGQRPTRREPASSGQKRPRRQEIDEQSAKNAPKDVLQDDKRQTRKKHRLNSAAISTSARQARLTPKGRRKYRPRGAGAGQSHRPARPPPPAARRERPERPATPHGRDQRRTQGSARTRSDTAGEEQRPRTGHTRPAHADTE